MPSLSTPGQLSDSSSFASLSWSQKLFGSICLALDHAQAPLFSTLCPGSPHGQVSSRQPCLIPPRGLSLCTLKNQVAPLPLLSSQGLQRHCHLSPWTLHLLPLPSAFQWWLG